MSLISANTLFHFTPRLEYLGSILRNDFYPRYCVEDWNSICKSPAVIPTEIALPMTCFWDIPLSSIKVHSDQYGRYALGMSKEWGKKVGISPLLYVHENADSAGLMFSARSRLNKFTGKGDGVDEVFSNVVDLLKYTKGYKGKLWRTGGFQDGEVLFYNEREWRYSPAAAIRKRMRGGETKFRLSLKKEEFSDPGILEHHNKLVQEFALPFQIDDIKYIIIDKESERLPAVDMIYEIKGAKFSYDQVREATTKILTMEQVFDDF